MAQTSAYLDFTVPLVRVASGETVDMADITMAPRGQRVGFDRQPRLDAILETIRAYDAECWVSGSPQILLASARPAFPCRYSAVTPIAATAYGHLTEYG
jgi:hypothetical protein